MLSILMIAFISTRAPFWTELCPLKIHRFNELVPNVTVFGNRPFKEAIKVVRS